MRQDASSCASAAAVHQSSRPCTNRLGRCGHATRRCAAPTGVHGWWGRQTPSEHDHLTTKGAVGEGLLHPPPLCRAVVLADRVGPHSKALPASSASSEPALARASMSALTSALRSAPWLMARRCWMPAAASADSQSTLPRTRLFSTTGSGLLPEQVRSPRTTLSDT